MAMHINIGLKRLTLAFNIDKLSENMSISGNLR